LPVLSFPSLHLLRALFLFHCCALFLFTLSRWFLFTLFLFTLLEYGDRAPVAREIKMAAAPSRESRQREREHDAARQLGAVWRYRDWVKTLLIGDLVPPGAEVCEMLCGRGRDVGKWARAAIGGYHGVDTREDRINHARGAFKVKSAEVAKAAESNDVDGGSKAEGEQAASLPKSPEFIVHDVFRSPMGSTWASGALVDCVCSFDGAARMFESVDTADSFLTNVASVLRPGGLFFGIVPDSSHLWVSAQRAILSRESAAGDDDEAEVRAVQVTGPLCSLRFRDGEAFDGKFGVSYKKQYAGEAAVEEFLVHFPSFTQLASQHNLRMLNITNFSQLLDFEDPDDTERVLLNADENQNLRRYQRELRQMQLGAPPRARGATGSEELWRPAMSSGQRETIRLDAIFVFEKVEPPQPAMRGEARAGAQPHARPYGGNMYAGPY
jgi:mRNA (guanine-N(7))-methyltransferase domain